MHLLTILTSLLWTTCCLWSQSNSSFNRRLFFPSDILSKPVLYAVTGDQNGDLFYFAARDTFWGKRGGISVLYEISRQGNKWSTPKPLPFSGTFSDSDPFLSYDGQWLYFISKRSNPRGNNSADIWKVAKDKNGRWGEPIHLGFPINSDQTEYSPKLDKAGNLYFASTRPQSKGQGDLFMAAKRGDHFDIPVPLDSTLNSPQGEWNITPMPRGDILFFEASERSTNLSGYGDLYISFFEKGAWSIPQNVQEMNTTGSDLYVHFNQSSQELLYTSSDSLSGQYTHIYALPAKPIIKKYKRQARWR